MKGILRNRNGKWFVEIRKSDGLGSHKDDILPLKSQMFNASLVDREVNFVIEEHYRPILFGIKIKEKYVKLLPDNENIISL